MGLVTEAQKTMQETRVRGCATAQAICTGFYWKAGRASYNARPAVG
jgi:hypothetical protein